MASRPEQALIQAISAGRPLQGRKTRCTWFDIRTQGPSSYLPEDSPANKTLRKASAMVGRASHRGPAAATSRMRSAATKRLDANGSDRPQTKPEGKDPARRHVMKYAAFCFSQFGSFLCEAIAMSSGAAQRISQRIRRQQRGYRRVSPCLHHRTWRAASIFAAEINVSDTCFDSFSPTVTTALRLSNNRGHSGSTIA